MPTLKTIKPLLVATSLAAMLAAGWGGLHLARVRLVLNLTISVPRGVYLVRQGHRSGLQHGDLVEFSVPDEFTGFVYGRRWLTSGTPLLKTVGGMPGDSICVGAGRFTLNGVDTGPVFTLDSEGKPMPALHGCVRVQAGDFLPINTSYARSFDGRYMGPVSASLITGYATPLWTF